MTRPLDIIPELFGATYSVTATPAMVHNNDLYIVSIQRHNKQSLYTKVAHEGSDFFVYKCVVEPSENRWGMPLREPTYLVWAVSVKKVAASNVPIRVLK